jgi:hypothetical protein
MKRVFVILAVWAAVPMLIWAQGGQPNATIDPRCTEPSQVACVDWANALAIAVGTGAPADWAKTPAQKNISATRAARLDAARNLLELVKGVNLTTSTSIQGAMVANDTVQSGIQGRLYGIRPVEAPRYFSDGSVQVKLEARLREIIPESLYLDSPAGAPRMLEPPGGGVSGGASLSTGQVYSGLIIDARGTKVTPAMSPKIYDPQGREVYGSAYVDRQWAVSQGVVGYVKSVEAARDNDRVKGTPAVVKAQEAKGANNADLVISQADADALRAIAQKQTFLRESRVMIVLD